MLEKNLGLNISNHDVFLNVVGGVKVNEPASDLAACIAIISSFKNKPLRQDTVIAGEVGLSSEIRSISQATARIKEAKRLGFKSCLIPKSNASGLSKYSGLKIIGIDTVEEAADYMLIQ